MEAGFTSNLRLIYNNTLNYILFIKSFCNGQILLILIKNSLIFFKTKQYSVTPSIIIHCLEM